MKTTILSLSILALTPLCFAQGGGDKPKRKGPPPAHIIEKFDTDGDGELNAAEKTAAKAHREEMKAEIQSIRASYDSDGDGQLTDSEKEAFRAEMKARAIEKFDANGDGQLSAEEMPLRPRGKKCANCDGKGKGKGKKGAGAGSGE